MRRTLLLLIFLNTLQQHTIVLDSLKIFLSPLEGREKIICQFVGTLNYSDQLKDQSVKTHRKSFKDHQCAEVIEKLKNIKKITIMNQYAEKLG